MTDYLSNLPVELIHKIYDDITLFDILISLCMVNKRLRFVSLNYPRFLLDFTYCKKKKQFELLRAHLPSISSSIVSLRFSNIYDGTIPIKFDYFFSNYNNINKMFPKLHSISLSHVDHNIWKSIKNHIKSLMSLTSLSIHAIDIFYIKEPTDFIKNLFNDLLFISSTLKYFCLKVNNDSGPVIDKLEPAERVSTIEHLILDNILVDLEDLFLVIPGLRTSDTMIDYCSFNRFRHVYPLEHLKNLSIDIYRLDFSIIKQLLYPVTRLVQLTIVGHQVNNDMANGVA